MHAALAVFRPHPAGAALDHLGLSDPARKKDACGRIGKKHLHRWLVGVLLILTLLVRHGPPPAGTGREEQTDGGLQPCGQRVVSRRDPPKHASRAGEIARVGFGGNVLERDPKQIDRPHRRGAQGDERTARPHELLDGDRAFGGQPAGVGGGYGAFGAPAVQLLRPDSGNHEHVEKVPELSGPQHLVADGRVGKLEGIQDVSHPSLVHVAAPRGVDTDPGQLAKDDRRLCCRRLAVGL